MAAVILAFPADKPPSPVRLPKQATADILLFLGVRYERYEDEETPARKAAGKWPAAN